MQVEDVHPPDPIPQEREDEGRDDGPTRRPLSKRSVVQSRVQRFEALSRRSLKPVDSKPPSTGRRPFTERSASFPCNSVVKTRHEKKGHPFVLPKKSKSVSTNVGFVHCSDDDTIGLLPTEGQRPTRRKAFSLPSTTKSDMDAMQDGDKENAAPVENTTAPPAIESQKREPSLRKVIDNVVQSSTPPTVAKTTPPLEATSDTTVKSVVPMEDSALDENPVEDYLADPPTPVALSSPTDETLDKGLSSPLVWFPKTPEKSTADNRKKRERTMLRWRRFWQVLYATLAVLELCTCAPVGGMVESWWSSSLSAQKMKRTVHHVMDKSTIVRQSAHWIGSIQETTKPAVRMVSDGFRETQVTAVAMQQTIIASPFIQAASLHLHSAMQSDIAVAVQSRWSLVVQSTTDNNNSKNNNNNKNKTRKTATTSFWSWQQLINAAFVAAMVLHTVMESWNHAARTRQAKSRKEEATVRVRSLGVTSRSRNRHQRLDNVSTNRHFIARWTGNRVRWSRTTTEVLRATCVLVVLQLLFLPMFRQNPVDNMLVLPKQPFGKLGRFFGGGGDGG